ncbi:gustatory receptor 2 isoform X2 [Nasonia vitripennis]|uniref:Gustatory receptor n=2 Tax=Nasonia vitripennis TaxID=7425 RepID=A0A7M7HBH1_NASVI|nr:gustatory receptor 2 isoform X2 [Nasonia vitripennis]
MYEFAEPYSDAYKLKNIIVCNEVMTAEAKPKGHRNASPRRIHFGIGRKMMSFFRSSKSGRGKPRSQHTPIFSKIHPAKRPALHSRRQSSNEDEPECFHRAIGNILLMSQFFGILPIRYIRSSSVRNFSFYKFAPRVIYSYFVLLAISVMTSISFLHLFRTLNANSFQTKGGIADATVGAMFYGNSLLGNLMFLRLCPKWISIQHDWRAMERLIDNNGKWKGPVLRWRFTLISSTILSLALLEHILSMVNNTPSDVWFGKKNLEDFLIIYTNKSHRFIVRNVDYNFTLGLFIFFISKVSTFTWNFTDLFIMLVSTGLAERYKRLNARILEATPAQLSVTDWHELRECYAVLSALVKKVDNEISGIILLSFTNNIYFICLQLLNGLSPSTAEHPIINSIYFFGSFIFLIGRTTAVTLLTARINDQCKLILPILYNCPSVNYCREAQRLQQQIATDDVALTGHRFFSITRNFMLAVAGAIVTYEVVLLQFNIALQRDEELNNMAAGSNG